MGYSKLQNYKFLDREYESSFGLNVTETDFRQYDSAVGRFYSIDALSEHSFDVTPYHCALNNPVYWADPTGLIYEPFWNSIWTNSPEGKNTFWSNMGGYFVSDQMNANGFASAVYYDGTVEEVLSMMYVEVKAGGSGINIDKNYSLREVYTLDGSQKMELFLVLGHEMAHVIDAYENPKIYMDQWRITNEGEIIKRSEIFASHIENQIRAESGRPLRKFYALSKAEGAKFNTPNYDTKLIDNKGNSLFYKQTPPSIFNAANRGEIFNNKYSHIKAKEAYNYYRNNPKTP